MKNFSVAALLAASLLVLAGCSSEPAAATPEQKKAFAGSAPPADYMKGINTAPPQGGPGGAPGGAPAGANGK